MGKNKVALAICFCLIVVLAGFSAWLYAGAKELESKVSDLESKISDLETQNPELETSVNELESRVSEQLLVVSYPTMDEPQSISFMIMHIGTAEVTISEVRVDDVLNSSSPGWVGNETLIPGQTGQITLHGLKYFADGFRDGDSYQFRFITARGNSFCCVILYEGWTIIPTEELKIVGLAWNDDNASFTVINTGTADLTIVEVRVNDEYATMNPSSVTLSSGNQATVRVTRTGGFISGVTYEFRFITAKGNQYFYMATAP
ncbi:MAG: hypothetical protein OEW62_03715 [Candidatus Bathyarchaeota archaeon]|nr:hypothetical protein [Candidatus Bathyarchaeota archaeon]MDH5595748.1 hypothetical protein [Candidatus Bathyarchaeota archaeon]